MLKKRFLTFMISLLISAVLFCGMALASQEAKENRSLEMDQSFFLASGSQERVLKIGLVDCILYALKKNSEILIKRIEPKLKEDDVKVAKAVFEPTLTAEYSLEDNTQLASNVLQGARTFTSQDANLNVGVSGKLPTGTQYEIDFLNERYKSDSAFQIFNPYYSTVPKVTITQPLFRGFGIVVNTADIAIARNNKLQSQNSFKDTAMDSIAKAITSYYNYIYSLEGFAIDKLSLQRAVDLFEINKARYDKGLVSSVDVLETETAVAQKEKILLSAESALKKAEDELKLVTNLVDDPEVWNARIELIDKPELRCEEVDLLKSLKDAFKNRPDYQSAKVDLNNRDIKIKVTKNALLPTLDLNGSFDLNGLGGDYKDALKTLNSSKYADWIVGAKLSIPWGSGDRAKYDQAKLEKAQALLSFKRLEQKITLEVRDKVREAKVQYHQVLVAKILREKENENYKAQKERYAAGQVSTHDMLDYQDKLSQAELGYIKSVVDHNNALVNLDRSQGLTLAKNNIKLEE